MPRDLSAPLATDRSLGEQLCAALGIDMRDVMSVTVQVLPGNVVTATAQIMVRQPDGEHFVDLLRREDRPVAACGGEG